MSAQTTIQELFATHYDGLSPQLRRAADFVAEHPVEVATRSLRQVAAATRLAPPTFSRLARALGLDAYEDLRDLCRQDLQRPRPSLAERALSLQQGDTPPGESGSLLYRQAAAALGNVQALADRIEPERLEAAAARLCDARRVLLVGTMSSNGFLDYLAYMAGMALPNWTVAGQHRGTLTADLIDLSPEDAVLVMTKSPYARQAVEAAALARESGAYVLAISDAIQSPILPYADDGFVVAVESPQFFPSYVATLVLLETIMGLVVRHGGDAAQKRIASVEKANHDFGQYWQ